MCPNELRNIIQGQRLQLLNILEGSTNLISMRGNEKNNYFRCHELAAMLWFDLHLTAPQRSGGLVLFKKLRLLCVAADNLTAVLESLTDFLNLAYFDFIHAALLNHSPKTD